MAAQSHLLCRIVLLFVAFKALSASTLCDASYGTNIQYEHCAEAPSPYPLLHPRETRRTQQRYSRDPSTTRKLYSMPQFYTWRTCSIGIDIADPLSRVGQSESPRSRSVSDTPRAVFAHMKQVADECIRLRGLGGRLEVRNFDVVIIHPEAGLAHGTSLAPKYTPDQSLGSAITLEVEAKRGFPNPLAESPSRQSSRPSFPSPPHSTHRP